MQSESTALQFTITSIAVAVGWFLARHADDQLEPDPDVWGDSDDQMALIVEAGTVLHSYRQSLNDHDFEIRQACDIVGERLALIFVEGREPLLSVLVPSLLKEALNG